MRFPTKVPVGTALRVDSHGQTGRSRSLDRCPAGRSAAIHPRYRHHFTTAARPDATENPGAPGPGSTTQGNRPCVLYKCTPLSIAKIKEKPWFSGLLLVGSGSPKRPHQHGESDAGWQPVPRHRRHEAPARRRESPARSDADRGRYSVKNRDVTSKGDSIMPEAYMKSAVFWKPATSSSLMSSEKS